MNHSELVLQESIGSVTRLILNRPSAYNALSLTLMNRLIERLDHLAEDTSVHVIILSGAGRGFCAGHDLKEMTTGADSALQQLTFETCSTLMQKLSQIPQPVIAQVHGIATAAGCQLVASCDLAVSASNARFATPGVNIGLFCSTPMVALTRTVAPKHAMEMLLTGDMVSAERAYEIGLVNRLVAEDDLSQATLALAEQLAAKSSATLAVGKQAFYQQLNQPVDQAYGHCSQVMSCNIQSDDAKEGIDAFFNKREPVWKGRQT